MDISSKSPSDLQAQLGDGIRALRLGQHLTQNELAAKAGVSLRAVHTLETGAGSSVASLVRVLKALNAGDAFGLLAPTPQVSPLALLKQGRPPRRVGRPRSRREGTG